MRRMAVGLMVGISIAAVGTIAAQDATLDVTPMIEATAEATAPAREAWTCPEGFAGQTLNVSNYSTYIAEDTVTNFEALCGVTVNYNIISNSDELLTVLRTGNPGYDIVVPVDYTATLLLNEGLLLPLTRANIPNLDNVTPSLLDRPFDPGNVYTAPYQWGTTGIGYHLERVGEPITSWAQVFAYDGPVVWLDDVRAMFAAAAAVLGYDPNQLTPERIVEARDFLIANSDNVVSIATDDGQASLERGDADIVIEYVGDILQLNVNCECADFVYVIPDEGTEIWIDNLSIPADAPNPALAEVFIDYILDPQVSADISNYTTYGSPNQVAIDEGLIDVTLLDNPAIYPPDAVRARLYTIEAQPDLEAALNDAWTEIKIALGT